MVFGSTKDHGNFQKLIESRAQASGVADLHRGRIGVASNSHADASRRDASPDLRREKSRIIADLRR